MKKNKTNSEKVKYAAPAFEIVKIEIEQNILQASGGTGTLPPIGDEPYF